MANIESAIYLHMLVIPYQLAIAIEQQVAARITLRNAGFRGEDRVVSERGIARQWLACVEVQFAKKTEEPVGLAAGDRRGARDKNLLQGWGGPTRGRCGG